MDYTIRRINTKIFTGTPSVVEEQVNVFLSTIDMLNYVDVKVANSDPDRLTIVIVYKVVQKHNQSIT